MSNPVQRKRLSVLLATALGIAAFAGPAGAAAPAGAPANGASAASPQQPAKTTPAPIDINSASRSQLKTLPGIGDVEADRIISGRPYRSKADLGEREVIPTGLYLSLKGRIVAVQKPSPKVKAP